MAYVKLMASVCINVILLLWIQIQLHILEAIVEVLWARNIRQIDLIFIFYFAIIFPNKGNPFRRCKLMGEFIHVFILHFVVLFIMNG